MEYNLINYRFYSPIKKINSQYIL
uniref:Uncharacterized protein n=1 Tax=Moumouvirus sp. 'Monve' TaxID=1128131 RepID=H2EF03_9VIRU|nr:hypothetical protein mv_R866 [Moumouvirus Monve]